MSHRRRPCVVHYNEAEIELNRRWMVIRDLCPEGERFLQTAINTLYAALMSGQAAPDLCLPRVDRLPPPGSSDLDRPSHSA